MSQDEERWIEFEACKIDDDDKLPNFDIFADPDPYETFSFNFEVKCENVPEKSIEQATLQIGGEDDDHSTEKASEQSTKEDDKDKIQTTVIPVVPVASAPTITTPTRNIEITLKGFKHEHERIFDSTGLTLWRASKLLCDFMCSNPNYIQNKSVLELGSGLGLCGILAYHLHASSVVMTDGDTDVLGELRQNVDRNLSTATGRTTTGTCTTSVQNGTDVPSKDLLPCKQLLWGDKHIKLFQQSIQKSIPNHNGSFDVIIASDVIYVDYILDDLFDTIVGFMSTTSDSKFYLAYARRAVDISAVFECATRHRLVWIEPEETEGVYIFSRAK